MDDSLFALQQELYWHAEDLLCDALLLCTLLNCSASPDKMTDYSAPLRLVCVQRLGDYLTQHARDAAAVGEQILERCMAEGTP